MDGADPDVVVGDALCTPELGPLFEELAGGPTRVLLVHHQTSWEPERDDRASQRALELRAVIASDWLVATSAFTAKKLTSEYSGRSAEVVVPGADRLPRLPRISRSDEPLRLLLVGSLIVRKRVPWLLDAIEGMPSTRLSLTILGDLERDRDHATALLSRIAASPRLCRCVTARGVVDDGALAAALAKTDALILPSSLEGYGMVIGEALHAGVPVVAALQAAEASSLKQHPAVITFQDAAGLRSILERLERDPALVAKLERSAREVALPQWNETIRSFREVLMRATMQATKQGPGSAAGP
jgi:glycosyltransferase involved in cell wall biosynthesis